MKNLLRILGVACAVSLLVCTFAACSSGGEKMTRVRVCEVAHSVFYAPQYVAISKGFFAEEGIDIELTNGNGADAVMSAVLSGNIDIGFAGPEAAIYVYNEGKEDYTEVFAQVTQRDGSFLVAREKDDNFNWAKLKGKDVLPGRKGGVPYMALEYVLRQNGLNPATDVNLDTGVQFSMMTAAFTGGNGDYFTCFEPTASMLQAEGKGYIVASVGEAAGEIPYTAYFAKKSYIEKNADLIAAFTRALYKGQQWVKNNTAADIAAAVQEHFPDTSLDLLTASIQRYKDIGAFCETPVMSENALNLLQTVMTAAGELDKTVPYDKLVNNTYAEKAIK